MILSDNVNIGLSCIQWYHISESLSIPLAKNYIRVLPNVLIRLQCIKSVKSLSAKEPFHFSE